ncbi:Uncharacterised protein [Streptococcus pneumoniae]|nr:Uncharacterised protein [Streptococcus pneumoniae]
MCFTHSFFHFATLRKSLQTTSASPCRIDVTDFRQFYPNLKTVRQSYLQPQNSVLSNLRLAS